MQPNRHSSYCQIPPAGNALAPILIIVTALAVSGGVFFFYTKGKIEEDAKAKAAAEERLEAVKKRAAEVALSGAPKSKEATAVNPTTAQPVKTEASTFGFARPKDIGEQVARSLATGDSAAAAKLLAAGDPAQEAGVQQMLKTVEELGFKVGDPAAVQLLGQSEHTMRLAIPLIKKDQPEQDLRLFLDVVKDPKMGWKVNAVRLPKELEPALVAALAAAPSAPSAVATPGGSAAPTNPRKSLIVVDAVPDALTFAADFVQAMLALNYNAAQKLVDEEKVPAVKLAGLCIVFEDGQYKLQSQRPLMATIATEDTSWVIVKVQSELRKEQTEFGLEMSKQENGWRVVGLNLSQLLSDNSKSSEMDGVPYIPLVQNPRGGESIALYFEYDSDRLHPRAQAQLKIVAEILKASPLKTLRISGHTDAKGTDAYNLNLSSKRAAAVKQFFLDQGVPLSQVDTAGFGAANPLSPNLNPDGSDNPEGRSRNRRAEILLDF